ncbi:MAG: NAD(+)/NADH kinase [Vampirovibrionales bacterium]|nr:NAD(+)/NADH kinase [Vampirovibrionales bacterium]
MTLPSSPLLKAPQRVWLVHHQSTDPEGAITARTQGLLKGFGVDVTTIEVSGRDCPVLPINGNLTPDLVMVIGGDGTVLRTLQSLTQQNRHSAELPVPLLAINAGKLGFLTRVEGQTLEPAITQLIAGKAFLDYRSLLTVSQGEASPANQQKTQVALNDVVLKHINPSQMTTLQVRVGEGSHQSLIATYDADGVIIATPSGSTAYTLSAGGPVVAPMVDATVLTPICPHSWNAKPIVLPAEEILTITPLLTRSSGTGGVMISIDGQEWGLLEKGESVTVTKANFSQPLVSLEPPDTAFYRVLKEKLHWGLNPRVTPQ